MDIQMTVGNVVLDAELNDTLTAGKVAAVLPLSSLFSAAFRTRTGSRSREEAGFSLLYREVICHNVLGWMHL